MKSLLRKLKRRQVIGRPGRGSSLSKKRSHRASGDVGVSATSVLTLMSSGNASPNIHNLIKDQQNPSVSFPDEPVLDLVSTDESGDSSQELDCQFLDCQEQLLETNKETLAANRQTNRALQDLSLSIQQLVKDKQQKDKDKEEDTGDCDGLCVDRATVRLDGLEVYAVVSALTVATAIACLDAYEQPAGQGLLALLVNTLFMAVSGAGIVAGLHATLVFSLMTMYGRTAVGVSNDEGFVEFFVQTGRVRYRGFFTFKWSLYCFLMQVVFTITSKCSPLLRPLIVTVLCYFMWLVYQDTQDVIDKASAILFNFKPRSSKAEIQSGNKPGDSSRHLLNKRRRSSTSLLQQTLSSSLLQMSDSSDENNEGKTDDNKLRDKNDRDYRRRSTKRPTMLQRTLTSSLPLCQMSDSSDDEEGDKSNNKSDKLLQDKIDNRDQRRRNTKRPTMLQRTLTAPRGFSIGTMSDSSDDEQSDAGGSMEANARERARKSSLRDSSMDSRQQAEAVARLEERARAKGSFRLGAE